jgi:hypothetical protein
MTDFFIAGTQSTPEIRSDWDGGALFMQGDSYPENSYELFNQVVEWIERFLHEEDRPLKIDLHLLYLNTSTIKAMMDIFDVLEAVWAQEKQVSVNWYYDKRNERVAELAEEFKEDCSFPFHILGN